MLDISILIIARNNYQLLNKLINSIRYQNSTLSVEIIILANQDETSITNFYNQHFQDQTKINSAIGNYFLSDNKYSQESCAQYKQVSIKKMSLVEFSESSYLETLNKTIEDLKSDNLLIVEEKYILGRNFFNTLFQRDGDQRTLLHPEFSVSYNGKTTLKQYNNKTPLSGLFEKNIFENIIFANKKCFKDIKFSNPFGSEFWQFYCDAYALGYNVKIASGLTIFENINNRNDNSQNIKSGILSFTGLFEGDNLLKLLLNTKVIQKFSKGNLLSTVFNRKTNIKNLVKNYVNGINHKYVNLLKTDDYKTLISEWKEANKIEPLLFPESNLTRNIGLIEIEHANTIQKYAKLCNLYKNTTRYLFLIPSIKIGGGTKVTSNYIDALLSKYDAQEITIITTDEMHNDTKLLQSKVNIINLREISTSVDEMALLLFRLIIQKSPYAVHNINSEVGYKLFFNHAKYLCNTSKLYVTHFVPNISVEGKIVGHMLEYLPSFYEYLTAVSTDNKTVINLMDELYGIGRDKYVVHYQPVQMPEENFSDRKKYYRDEQEKNLELKVGTVKILWASRIDYQKNISLLYEIARYFAERPMSKSEKQVEFLIAGIVEENSTEIYNKLIKLPNVKYIGPFSSVKELPINECDLFLYTSRSDGIPTILLEILILGKLPIIASGVGAITEIIGERNGVLCRTIDDFKVAINSYIQDDSVYDVFVLHGQEYVLSNHNSKQLIQKIKEFKDYY